MFTSTLLLLLTDLEFIDLIKFIHLSKLNSLLLILITNPSFGILFSNSNIYRRIKLPFLYNMSNLYLSHTLHQLNDFFRYQFFL